MSPADGYTAAPRHKSPVPEDTDVSGAQETAEKLGFPLFPQGLEVARLLEAKNEDGTPLYPEVVIQMGRRATKTTSIQAVLLHRCLSIPGYKVISTAQKASLAHQFLHDFGVILESVWEDPDTRPFRFYKSNGAIKIVFENGSVWRAAKPAAEDFRGSAADVILFDEAGEYSAAASEDLKTGALPVMATRPNAQLIVTGTPPRTREGMLWDYLRAGRTGTEDLGILDYSMDPKADATDEAVWRAVYPGLASGLVSIKFLRKALATQGLLGFSREYLCLDPVASSMAAIDPEDWAATTAEEFPEVPPGFTLSFDCAVDGSSAALALAFYDSEGRPHCQILDYRSGISWLPHAVAGYLKAHRGLTVVYDSVGHNVAVSQKLQSMQGVPTGNVGPLTMKDVAAGVSLFTTAVSDRALVHVADRDLDAAVDGVTFRYVSDSRLWGRKHSTADVSPLVACSNALFKAAGKRQRSTDRQVKALLF